MQVGDRVMVKDGGYSGDYGYIERVVNDHATFEWSVVLDRHRQPVWFGGDSLLPVDVVVLEGEQRWDERLCKWYIGDESLDDHLDNNGDTVRLTIERVKKEG